MIGTNKIDAEETVATILADLPHLMQGRAELDNPATLLDGRCVRPVDWQSWLRLDAAEIALGTTRQADRVKIADLDAMLQACHGIEH